MKKNIKVGLIGLGPWGIRIYKTLKENFPNLKINSITVKTGKNLYLTNKDFKVYKNWEKMINNEKLDYLFVAVPPKYNFNIFKKTLKKKIPLFLEKPMTTVLIEGKKMVDIYKRSKSVVHINHIDLFNNAIQFLLKRQTGIKKIFFQITSPSHGKNYISPLFDLAPHSIAVILNFFKTLPLSIIARELKIDKRIKSDLKKRSMVNLNMKFSKNRSAEITIGNGTIRKIRKAKFYTKNKIFNYDNYAKNLLTVFEKNKKRNIKIKNIKNEPSLQSSIKYFLSRNKKKPNDVELGLKILKILNLSVKSLNQQKEILL